VATEAARHTKIVFTSEGDELVPTTEKRLTPTALLMEGRGTHPDGLKVKALAPVGTYQAIQVDQYFSAKWTKNRQVSN
jgi:hypothetical protein